ATGMAAVSARDKSLAWSSTAPAQLRLGARLRMRALSQSRGLWSHHRYPAEYVICGRPAIDATAVVPDQELQIPTPRLTQVQELIASNRAQHDVVWLERRMIDDGLYCHKLAAFDAPGHGTTSRAELHGFTVLQPGDVVCGPAH